MITHLAEGFVKHNAYGGGEVQAAHIWIQHRYLQAVVPIRAQQCFRQASCFGSKDKAVVVLKAPFGLKAFGFCSEIHEPRVGQRLIERFEISMAREVHLRPVIEARSFHCTIVHAKACNADDVKRHVRRSTQASDVAGVRWNLRFYERH